MPCALREVLEVVNSVELTYSLAQGVASDIASVIEDLNSFWQTSASLEYEAITRQLPLVDRRL